MANDFDVIVIGSGFGGAVAACRLAESNYKVLVLERGRRWKKEDYPSVTRKDYLWDENQPEKNNGWLDIRFFGTISTLTGAGVGGGSLHYANVSIDAHKDLFASGWPKDLKFEDLEANYYPKVKQMLESRTIPPNQFTNRTKIIKEAAQKTGFSHIYKEVDLAIRFNDAYAYESTKEPKASDSVLKQNAEKILQGFCVHLGQCDLGCPVDARNTLTMNYIPRAERFGAKIWPLHRARNIEPTPEGYIVRYERIENGLRLQGSVTARIVIVSAGSIGSSELLLRCRDKFNTLPALSKMLGHKWSTNANYLSFAVHPGRNLYPMRGPTITTSIQFMAPDEYQGSSLFVEDGGAPDALIGTRQQLLNPTGKAQQFAPQLNFLGSQMAQDPLQKDLMYWFSQGRDEPIGTFSLKRQWLGLFGPKVLNLSWNPQGARKVLDAIQDIHRKLANATGSTLIFQVPDALMTPHPLGGCPMGESSQEGVVDHRCETFGYKNLFVSDGSIMPRPIGHNPSKTIAAFSERMAALIIADGR